MTTAYILKGHVNPDGTVVCDEKAPLPPGPIELTLRQLTGKTATNGNGKGILETLDSIPLGTRSKQDMDAQIQEERNSWDKT